MNQAWAGHSGSPFKQSAISVELADFKMELQGQIVPHNSRVPSWQFFYKPVGVLWQGARRGLLQWGKGLCDVLDDCVGNMLLYRSCSLRCW